MKRMTLAVLVCAIAATALTSSAGSENPRAGRIAFASDYPLSPTHHPQVLAIGTDGRQRRDLGGDAIFAYHYPRLSPDRSRVAFVRHGPASSELWIVGVDGRDRRRLLAAPTGMPLGPIAWSADGTVVAVGLGNPDDGFNEVWLARADASVPAPHAKFRDGPYGGFTWSPKGDLLALEGLSYAGCGPGIFKWCASWYTDIVDAGGARIATLDDARNVSWSPDGRRLAFEKGNFTELGEEGALISIARADGSPVRTISSPWPSRPGGSCPRFPRWSPDGRWVSYLLDTGCDWLRLVSVFVRAGGTWNGWRVPWVHAKWSAGHWSPDGSRLLFLRGARGRNALYVSRADGLGRRRIASGVVEAGWSPTGAVVWLGRVRRHAVLFTASDTGRGARRLTSVHSDASLPVFARGRGFAVTVATSGSTRIYRGDVRSGRLVPFASEPARSSVTLLGWSRDRQTVVYSAQDQTRRDFEIWTTDPDGADPRRLTTNDRDDRWPVWSPDGTRIAFVRDLRESEAPRDAVLIAPADGGVERQLAVEHGGVLGVPAWSPDGTTVAYSSLGRVVVADSDGSGSRRLTSGESPVWSPDGTEIAFSQGGALRVIHPDGTGERTVASNAAQPAWSPDGTEIAFVSAGALKAIRPDGTGERTVVSVSAISIHWSPDGTKLAFARPCCGPEQGVFVIDADGSDLHRVAGAASQPSWAPDGSRLVVDGPGAPDGFFMRLFVVDADGSNVTPITTAAATSAVPSWGPRP
jgi:Tol biopolymer transport system component